MIFDVIKKAKQLLYDDSNTGLGVNNVQDAIDNLTQAIVEVDAVNEGSGESILLTDTLDDTVLDFKAYGRSTQIQYSGKNLFDCSRIATLSANGATLTNNNDGSITISGSGVLSNAFNTYFDYSHEETVRLLKEGELKLDINGVATTPYLYIQLRSGTNVYFQISSNDVVKAKNVTQAMLDDENVYLRVGFYGASTGATIVGGTMKPMLFQSEDNTYEPYVGGVASPNPDYPQEIVNVSRSYFDGELFQGIRDSNGTLVATADSGVTNTNLIPCNVGDEIKVTYAENAPSLGINFYDEAKKRVSGGGSVSGKNEITYKATNANARYCGFYVGGIGSGITPANAKKITVAINGKECVLEVKSVGKNLIPYPYRDTTHTDGNAVIWTDNGDGTITANGTDNSRQVQQFYLIMDGAMGLEPNTTYILNGCPGVGSLSTYNLRLIINRGLTGSTWIEYRDFGNGVTFTTPSDYKHCSIMIDVLKGTTVSNLLVKPMLRRAEVTDNTYEPYKESVTYIPLNEPLRSLGNVKDEVNLDEGNITRRFKEVIFDGSDELWSDNGQQASGLYRYNIGVADLKKQRMGAICTHFTPSNAYQFSEIKEVCFSTHPTSPELAFFTEYATLTEFKTWLQANPITVQYELAEPITETIEPVDIVTYDNTTYITANADMWVEYYSNSSVGQRLAKTDNKLAELDTVKELYNTPTVKARKCGKIIELTGSACTENELNQCLTALVNIGYAPDSITVLCMYNTGNSGDSSVGRLSMLGNYIVVSDMSNENFISNYNISFNAMWITG